MIFLPHFRYFQQLCNVTHFHFIVPKRRIIEDPDGGDETKMLLVKYSKKHNLAKTVRSMKGVTLG